MEILGPADVQQIIAEIQGDDEESRRALSKRRQDIYRDGGKEFLLEQIVREFSKDAVKEMRIAPINLLKKIVNKRSSTYKNPPVRAATNEQDQVLVDFYVEELELNAKMMKAHRYFNLHSNTAIYPIPEGGKIKVLVVPPYLYSVKANPIDKTKIDTWVFNSFIEEGRITPFDDVPTATGSEGFNRQKGHKTTSKDLVESQERPSDIGRRFIFWSDAQHFTVQTGENGHAKMILDPSKDETQIINPIGIAPVVNLAKDRDNEAWATQGEDLIDLTMAIQLGWTDVLTIAKNQGFSILTMISEEEPKKLTIGVNRGVWLRPLPDSKVTPSISYVQAQSPLSEYKELLSELLGLLLSTNDMNPSSISGAMTAQSATSGFHALIEAADTIEATKSDEVFLKNAELDTWEIIKRWHNLMFDMGVLDPDAAQLGKFTEEFKVSVTYREIKPIESEQEKITAVKELIQLGLITRKEAVRKLNPDLTEEEIEQKMQQLDEEKREMMSKVLGEPGGEQEGQV